MVRAGGSLVVLALVLERWWLKPGALGSLAVSELPGYPGRRHAQRSRYATAKFP